MTVQTHSFADQKITQEQANPSAIRFFFLTITSIFLAEVIAMIVIRVFAPEVYWIETLMDATIMVTIILPVLFQFSYRPLTAQIQIRKRSETLLASVLENLPVGVWITDRSGNILQQNRASIEIWGCHQTNDDGNTSDPQSWWYPNGAPIQRSEWPAARALERGEIVLNQEIKIKCSNGTYKIILNSATPIFDQTAIQGAITLSQDISQRIEYEEALIQSNQLVETAFNSIDTLIAYMDRDFNYIRVNEAFAKTCGQTTDFFVNKNHFELMTSPEKIAIFRRVVEHNQIYSAYEQPFQLLGLAEQKLNYWNWSLQPVGGSNGAVQGIVLSLINVTERKNAQELLERRNHELLALSLEEHSLRFLTEGLVQSTLALNANLDLEDVLLTILRQVQRAIPYQTAHIAISEGDKLRVVIYPNEKAIPAVSSEVNKTIFPEEFPFYNDIVRSRQPILISNTDTSPEWRQMAALVSVHSFVAVPLLINGIIIGSITISAGQPGIFNQETVDRLMVFAAPAAVAVQNVRLYQAEMHSRQLAETLSTVSMALTQTLDLETVLDTLLDNVCSLVPYDSAYIAIAEDELRFSLRAWRGKAPRGDPPVVTGITFETWDIPHIQEVISNHKSLVIPDTEDHPGWSTTFSHEKVRNWVGIPMLVGGKSIGILSLSKDKPAYFNPGHIRITEAIVAQASVAVQNAWLFEQVRAGHQRLQSLSRRLVEVQESERRYIARELHDETSQALTSIMYGLSVLEQDLHEPEKLHSRVIEMKQVTDRVLEDLHRLAANLRPASLDHLGLVIAIESLVKDMAQRYPLNIHSKAIGFVKDERLPDYVETALYRIVQEALTNTIRHADAQNVDVILERREGKVVVFVEDDGKGFNTTQIRKSGHLGLLGIQERAQMMGGNLNIESEPGSGTTIVVEVPYGDSNLDR